MMAEAKEKNSKSRKRGWQYINEKQSNNQTLDFKCGAEESWMELKNFGEKIKMEISSVLS